MDYYAEAESIAEQAVEEGEAELASNLRDAIRYGATGTEILMRLRHHSRESLGGTLALRQPTRDRLAALVAAIDQALG
jgi:hypothetical protein